MAGLDVNDRLTVHVVLTLLLGVGGLMAVLLCTVGVCSRLHGLSLQCFLMFSGHAGLMGSSQWDSEVCAENCEFLAASLGLAVSA